MEYTSKAFEDAARLNLDGQRSFLHSLEENADFKPAESDADLRNFLLFCLGHLRFRFGKREDEMEKFALLCSVTPEVMTDFLEGKTTLPAGLRSAVERQAAYAALGPN